MVVDQIFRGSDDDFVGSVDFDVAGVPVEEAEWSVHLFFLKKL
jgi:hypothetical protein